MRKLNPVAALVHALTSLGDFWAQALRIGLPWVGIMVAGNALLWWLGGGTMAQTASDFGVADGAVAALSLVGVSSLAVNWHRFILRDDMPDAAGVFRLDAPVWNYLIRLLVIMVVTVAPLVFIMMGVARSAPAFIMLGLIPLFLASVLALRLSLVLPAVALGRKDVTFKQALDASAYNFGPLAFLTILNACVLLAALMVANVFISAVVRAAPAFLPAAMFILALPLNLFLVLFSVTISTTLYGFFMENRDF